MNAFDGIFIAGIIMVLAVIMGATGLIWNEFNTSIQASDLSTEGKTLVQTASNTWPGAMDWIFMAIMIGLPLISMGLASFIDTPPTFFYLLIGVILVMVFIGYGFQSAWEDIIAAGGVFGTYMATSMPMANYLMLHYGWYALFSLAITGMGVYVKQRGGYQ